MPTWTPILLALWALADGGPTPPGEAIDLTVIPPGPVSDKIRVEARASVPNPSGQAGEYRVRFSWDGADEARPAADQVVTVGPHGVAVARAWLPTVGRVGARRLLCRVTGGGQAAEAGWPLDVVASETPAPPAIHGVWLDPLALSGGVYAREKPATERDVRHAVTAYRRLGVGLLIVTYVEYQGSFFYPSRLRFHDRDMKREAGGERFAFDVVGTVLSQADREGMRVILGLGRGGDTQLLWEFDKPDWKARNEDALRIGRQVARDLWRRYGRHPSFYGWYLTHEMNDLARSSAYYDPLADACHALAPAKPVMVAPAGTPVLTREGLRRSHVDIFAYQDAVGAGYVPYRYTYRPEERLATLGEVFEEYRSLHEGSGKHLWADLEVWEMDGKAGYAGAYAAPFARVKKQLAREAASVEAITAYEGFGLFEPPGTPLPLKDRRPARLFADYEAYLQTLPARAR